MTLCCWKDGCDQPTSEGTYYCVLHLGILRAERAAALFAGYDAPFEDEDCAAEGTSEVQMEAVGQLNVFGNAA